MLVQADDHASELVPQGGLAAQGAAALRRSRRYADGRRGSAGSMPHIAANTGLNSFMRPSAPNTATPSLSASSVSPCTWVSAVTCEASA